MESLSPLGEEISSGINLIQEALRVGGEQTVGGENITEVQMSPRGGGSASEHRDPTA
jgi:hypothetical protein